MALDHGNAITGLPQSLRQRRSRLARTDYDSIIIHDQISYRVWRTCCSRQPLIIANRCAVHCFYDSE
jgi:hypothetical protein